MTAALAALVVLNLLALVIATDSKRRDRAHAQAMHPSNWGEETEAAIEQAVAIVDDGKALVRETEDYLRGRHA